MAEYHGRKDRCDSSLARDRGLKRPKYFKNSVAVPLALHDNMLVECADTPVFRGGPNMARHRKISMRERR